MRLKSCRLFNSAYFIKKNVVGNRDLFIFPLSLFYPHFQQRGVSTLYILCCERGMHYYYYFFLLVTYTYVYYTCILYMYVCVCVENIYTHTYSIYNIWGDFLWKINHEHSWCICKTTMYVQYACKCCPGVARVHLTLSALGFLLT